MPSLYPVPVSSDIYLCVWDSGIAAFAALFEVANTSRADVLVVGVDATRISATFEGVMVDVVIARRNFDREKRRRKRKMSNNRSAFPHLERNKQ